MASSSNPIAAAATTTSNYYDVFLSHRGPDVKEKLASHLYRRLNVHGLRVFLDKEELEAGDHIPNQLKAAIFSASVHIAIFSTNYAASRWCLNELLWMLKSGKTIVPIFYGVKPDVLKWTLNGNGVYGRHLSILEGKETVDPQSRQKKPRYDRNCIQEWRNALFTAGHLVGFVVEAEACNSDDSQLVDNVVERVLKELPKTPLNVSKYPTGLDDKVRDFQRNVLMPQQSGETRVVGIVGLGGVGKTTLAKEYFNRERSKYHRSCFLPDVREKAAARSLDALLSTLVKELTKSEVQMDSTAKGIEELRRRVSLCHPHALIILDDVEYNHQLDVLLSTVKDALSSGSLILVTSRNKDVLTSFGIVKTSIYKLEGLNPQHSQELFCSHAFGQPHPAVQFEPVVKDFLNACQGLPLSLQVIGALLHGKDDLRYWEEQLHKISRILPADIRSVLKISYDGLDEEEKKIFLDIACFFTGDTDPLMNEICRDKDTAIRVWDGSGWQGRLGLRNLQNRCLVDVVESDGKRQFLRMHDHVRDLGRYLAENEPLGGHRLWQPIPDPNFLHNLSDQSVVRGLVHVDSTSSERRIFNPVELSNRPTISIRRLELLMTTGHCWEDILRGVKSPEDLIWLHSRNFPYDSLSRIPMQRLSVLNVEGKRLRRLWGEGNFEAPLQLRQLHIVAALLEFPKSIGRLKYLEKIVVQSRYANDVSPLKTLPDEFCHLQCLQHLEFDGFSEMESLPESFGNLKNLRHLQLDRCSKLRRLPNSCGNLIRLKYLSLVDCTSLTMSSKNLCNISTLEIINMNGCKKIKVLPRQVAHQRNLSMLALEQTSIRELPSGIADLRALEHLSLPPLEMPPAWLGCIRSLKCLSIDFSANLKCLPDSMRELTKLETLVMQFSGVECLPPWIMKLNNLVELHVVDCPLRELPFNRAGGERETGGNSTECMLGLRDLYLASTRISAVAFGRGVCPNLQTLYIFDFQHLAEIGTLPNSLIELELGHCLQLEKIEGLCGLSKLKTLIINECPKVKELPGLGTLTSLEGLHLRKCGVTGILDLQQLTKLQVLKVSKCHALEELAGINHVRTRVSRCRNLRWGEDLRDDSYPTADDANDLALDLSDRTSSSDDDAGHETYVGDDTSDSRQQVVAINEYDVDFRGDPDLALPEGAQWGAIDVGRVQPVEEPEHGADGPE